MCSPRSCSPVPIHTWGRFHTAWTLHTGPGGTPHFAPLTFCSNQIDPPLTPKLKNIGWQGATLSLYAGFDALSVVEDLTIGDKAKDTSKAIEVRVSLPGSYLPLSPHLALFHDLGTDSGFPDSLHNLLPWPPFHSWKVPDSPGVAQAPHVKGSSITLQLQIKVCDS